MITNAQTSHIELDRKALKALMRRSDLPGLIHFSGWMALLVVAGFCVWLALGTWWVVPAILVYSVFFCVPAYAFSHECAHGTAFRTRRLNEIVFWITSLLYFEEPLHRRYAHASHHTHTWIEKEDAQMPFVQLPMTFWGWVEEVLGLGLYWNQIKMFVLHSFGRFSSTVREFTPESELPRMMMSTRYCLAIYLGLGIISYLMTWYWPLYLIVLPRIIGGPVMNMYILIQHAEMAENQPNIVQSTRSFRTNRFGRFIYCNMNYHIEHHLYPMVPFSALPNLSETLKEQLPTPDPGFVRTNLEVLKIVFCRTFGTDYTSTTIRKSTLDHTNYPLS